MKTQKPRTGISGWRRRARRSAVLAALVLACFSAPEPRTRIFRAPEWNTGAEAYSAWFADARDGVLYFGLSPFWTLWWAGEGPHADLAEPGDHLIGRFDLDREVFLEPLRVRARSEETRGSVWDVLAHSNGRVYYTTYFEEIGWVDPATGEVTHFEGLGAGFNELWEGRDGRLFATRYSNAPRDARRQTYGAVVALSPDGELLGEWRFDRTVDEFTAPKSVAVDARTGDIWLNADVFGSDGRTRFAWLHLDAGGGLIARGESPELHFVSFDRDDRGWFVEDLRGALRVRVVYPDGAELAIPLGPREPSDFAQDIRFDTDGRAAIAFWSGRVVLVRLGALGVDVREFVFERPADCRAPEGRSVVYTAVPRGEAVYATLFCGATVLRAAPAFRRGFPLTVFGPPVP